MITNILYLIISDLPQVSVEMSGDVDDISQGDTVTISCRASGNPTPDIVWYRDGSGEIVSRSHTLTIADIRRDQAGVYVCQADNSVGQSEPRKIDVAVKCEYYFYWPLFQYLNCSKSSHISKHFFDIHISDFKLNFVFLRLICNVKPCSLTYQLFKKCLEEK